MLIKLSIIFKALKTKQLNGLVFFIACRNFSKTDSIKIEKVTFLMIITRGSYYLKKC